MAEDKDYEQDSEAYRKWRSGEDNDRYASSKTPSETGARSGSYSIPKADDEYALPGEEDNSGGGSWLDGDMNWPVIIIVFVVIALVLAAVFAAVISSTEPDTKPSEWPETEGKITYQGNNNTFIGSEYCDDKGEEPVYDDECYKDFIFELDVDVDYIIDSNEYKIKEVVVRVESYTIYELDPNGDGIYEKQEEYYREFKNYWNEEATNGTLSINSTVIVKYNPEDPQDGYSFAKVPDDPLGFVGWFMVCCGGLFCIPIIIGGIILSWAQRATSMDGGYRRNRWRSFGGFGNNNRRHGSGSGARRRGSRGSGGGPRKSGGRRR